jgi:hypothetical protein
MQGSLDDFLHKHLGLRQYDRLYMPGGPGALAQSGHEEERSEQWRRESLFLLDVHGIREVVLIFHAATEDGPSGANCADYARKLPSMPMSQLHAQQHRDALEVLQRIFGIGPFAEEHVRVRIFRAEVRADFSVQFIEMAVGEALAGGVS